MGVKYFLVLVRGIHSEIYPSILDTQCILSMAIHCVSDEFHVLLTSLCFFVS